jgi:hypothetical protein
VIKETNMNLVYEANWHTHSEWGGIRIYEDENECFHVQYGGHSVYSSPKDPDWEEPYIVSPDTVLELIDEWVAIEKQNEEYWECNYS